MENFICSITQQIFKEPVVLSDGHIYEKDAIIKWLEINNTSPLTREIVTLTPFPNKYFSKKLEKFLKEHPEYNNKLSKAYIDRVESLDDILNEDNIVQVIKLWKYTFKKIKNFNVKINNLQFVIYIANCGSLDALKMAIYLGLEFNDIKNVIIEIACSHKKTDMALYLINKLSDEELTTELLFIACFYADLIVMNALLKRNINPNIKPKTELGYCTIHTCMSNMAAIHVAAKKGFKATKLLMDYGVDINVKDDYGVTALMIALLKNDFELAEYLVKHGAKYNIPEFIEFCEKHHLFKSLIFIYNHFGLEQALINVPNKILDKSRLSAFTSKYKFIGKAMTQGRFYKIFEYNNIDLTELFKYNKLDDIYPLMIYIINNAKDLNVVIDEFGNTITHQQVEQYNLGMVDLLISKGVNLTIKNTSGKTPLECAAKEMLLYMNKKIEFMNKEKDGH